MNVVEVDHVRVQPLQAGIASFLHIVFISTHSRLAIDAKVAELGTEEDIPPSSSRFKPFANQLLVRVGTVYLDRSKYQPAALAVGGFDTYITCIPESNAHVRSLGQD